VYRVLEILNLKNLCNNKMTDELNLSEKSKKYLKRKLEDTLSEIKKLKRSKK